MHRVTILATVHSPIGVATASKLTQILEEIRPDAIFMEMPNEAFDQAFQVFRRTNLESHAIVGYRENHRAALLPVDLPTPNEDFFINWGRLHEILKAKSEQYKNLFELDRNRIYSDGFKYLNSESCETHWETVDRLIASQIDQLHDSDLSQIYNTWAEHNDRRESAMMKNISLLCSAHSFNNPVFLVGAAHRRAMVRRAVQESTNRDPGIHWVLPTVE